MMIAVKMGKVEVIILVDLGSTHNFVDTKLVKRLKLSVEQSCQLKVMLANGGSLTTRGLCRARVCY